MVCLYHRADLDGKGSGFLIKRFLKQFYAHSDFIGMDYSDDCNFLIEKCENKDVVIVDFAISNKDVFIKILEVSKSVLWIDHHASSHKIIENMSIDKRHTIILGDNSISAIEMVWNHFSSTNAPMWVKYISMYDTWNHNNNDNILMFIMGLNNKATSYNSFIWNELEIYPENTIVNLIKDGLLLQEFVDGINEIKVNEHAREIVFEGIVFLSLNTVSKGSLQFKKHKNYEKYSFFMTYNLTKNNTWKYNMYTDDSSIDLSEIAIKYGGGGHKGACGFSSDKLLF